MTERPLECSHCKKHIKVIYKEVIGETIICSEMCQDCPILENKLHGRSQETKSQTEEENTSLCCANCMTTLEAVKMGYPLGCSNCYSVFEDILIKELIDQDKLPPRLRKELLNKHSIPLHLGKSPGNTVTIPSSTRLTSLNEALNDALKKENYEQAAWLRDQIKEIMEKK
ncbi:MAG: UvrB/UvrC motif-containing protein [Verrucomicrobia bacterium]|nr:UvrB/UvrC motif-containing protein [Verrucomicrobiota bacterium]